MSSEGSFKTFVDSLLHRLKLRLIQFMVEAACGHQAVMSALFHDLAVAHDQNMVCGTDGGKTVGNNEAGLIFHQFSHRSLNLLLRPGIHIGSGFIQNQHVSVQKHGSGDGEKLLLSFGYTGAIV